MSPKDLKAIAKISNSHSLTVLSGLVSGNALKELLSKKLSISISG
jgi:hypothetical protein